MGKSRSGEQAWELLESPSSQSHEDEKLIENGRLDSSESTPADKGGMTSVGFGSAALVHSTEMILAPKPAQSPKTPTTPKSPVTPVGKAKLSWATNLSVPSLDQQRHEEVGLSGPIDGGKHSFDKYNYLGSIQEEERSSRKCH